MNSVFNDADKTMSDNIIVRVIGPEVFGLNKRERMKWFKAPFCHEIGRLLGESQVEGSRYGQREDGAIMVGCILVPGDVWRLLCNSLMRYLVVLGEPDSDALHGIFVVRTVDDFVFNLTDLYIEPQYRHKGLGRKMLDAFLGQLRKDRKGTLAKVEVSVALGNDKAKSFYEKIGFQETALEMQLDTTEC